MKMSEAEVTVTVLSGIIALLLWGRWVARIFSVRHVQPRGGLRAAMCIGSVVWLVAVLALLRAFAAGDVRNDSRYLAMYTIMGAAWVALALAFTRGSGVRLGTDALERGNGAAAALSLGLIGGLSLAYAGANFGDGPGWWVVVYCALVSTVIVLGFLYVVAACADDLGQVVVDRSMAAGIRLAAALIAVGALAGRAVAGNWVSASATNVDVVQQLWAIAVLAGAECVWAIVLRPTPSNPVPSVGMAGVLPATAYLGFASWRIWDLGWWS